MKYTITKVEITAVSVFEKYYHHNLFTFLTISLYSGPGIPSRTNKKTDISMQRPNSCIILQDFLKMPRPITTLGNQTEQVIQVGSAASISKHCKRSHVLI